jgi:hypothetical protein
LAAEKIILSAASKKFSAAITASTVTDIYYIVSKNTGKENAREISVFFR